MHQPKGRKRLREKRFLLLFIRRMPRVLKEDISETLRTLRLKRKITSSVCLNFWNTGICLLFLREDPERFPNSELPGFWQRFTTDTTNPLFFTGTFGQM